MHLTISATPTTRQCRQSKSLLAFPGKHRIDNSPQALGQILELADVIGIERLVARPAPPNVDLGLGWRRRQEDLIEAPDLLGRQRMWSAASPTVERTA